MVRMAVKAKTERVNIPYIPGAATVRTYDNGYTLVFIPKPGDVFNINTWVRTGSIHEDGDINGISHFLEHLMFKGTERFKPGEFDRAMESMGAVINAATWKDFTYYYVTGPKGPAGENFDKALDMHADMMLHSTIPDEEVGPPYDPFDASYAGEKRERSVVIEEIGMREDQPWTKIFNAVNSMMYPEGHPYRMDVIGTRQIIGSIPRRTILDYYRHWYSPASMTTVVVGDFELDALEARVLKAFDFSRVQAAPVTTPLPSPQGITQDGAAMLAGHLKAKDLTRYVAFPGDFQTSFFITGYHGPQPENLDEVIALDVISQVLGESRSSRLEQELVEKPEVPNFTFLSCGQSTYKLGNVFYVQGNFVQPDIQDALAQVRAEMDKLLTTDPVTAEEMRRAVKSLKVGFAETSETASGLSETVGESLTVTGTLDSVTRYLDALESLDLATVNRVARELLTAGKAYTAVLYPKK